MKIIDKPIKYEEAILKDDFELHIKDNPHFLEIMKKLTVDDGKLVMDFIEYLEWERELERQQRVINER